MRYLRRALWAQENCCWLERYTSHEDEKYSSRPDTCLCVVSLLQAWLSIHPKILPEILYTSTSFKSCRCQLYCIIVDSILNRQADYISSSIRLAAYTSMRRIAPLDVAAGQPGLQLINKYHTCLRVALLLQAWLSIPPKILPIRSYFRRKLHLFDFSHRKARDKSGVASPRFPGR